MADTKWVDGVELPLSAAEQARISARRIVQEQRQARSDDEVAEQDFLLGLNGLDPVLRATIEALADAIGIAPAVLRASLKAKLIANNFYRSP
jgi:ABC-type transporter Mla subunit MlaD